MFKKGFTIFELLVIILVLSLLGCFGLVSVFKTMRANRECKYEAMKEQIIDASKIYVESNNELSYKLNNIGYLNIKLGELQDAGFIDRNLKNPKTNKVLPSNYYINVTKNGDNTIIYEFREENFSSKYFYCNVFVT